MVRLFFCIILFSILLSGCSENIVPRFIWGSGSTEVTRYATGLTDEEKVELALKRKKELRTIRKGDYMTLKNNPEQALLYYKNVLEELPDDIVIRRKIAHVYYLLRDYKNAYENYHKVPINELKEDEQKELLQSLFLDDLRLDRLTELWKLELTSTDRDYYKTLDTCYSGIHNCIVNIEAYTGKTTRILTLQRIIKNSTQISPDYQYRNFLVAAELYKQWAYRATDILTKEILSKRPNYTEVRKLRGFSLFELGRYTEARDILLVYLESHPEDLESIIRLGDIYSALGDFTSSSLYLNNVIAAGYKNKSEIERRLAYNYAALGDQAGMLKVLSYLIQESDVTEDDYAVAISLALREWENIRAYAWSYAAIEKYKNSPILTPLYLSALRLNDKASEIPVFVSTLPDDLQKNPLIQLEHAISLYELGQVDIALPIFTAIHELDSTVDWAIEAGEYIRAIEAYKSQTGAIQQ